MSDRAARRKQKQRIKRKQKQRELHRAHRADNPYARGASGELVGCWINHDWRERGQATAWVLRRGVGGGLAMAAFLVDAWCAGLKDAWGLLDVRREDFDRARQQMSDEMNGTIAPCPLAVVRHVVAGGIRFAMQNGFRLAHRYDRWTAFLGSPPLDLRNADLDGFGLEDGRLRWVAPLEDLRTRYIGGRLEDFLAREDVEFVFDGQGTSFDESEDDAVDDEHLEESMEAFKDLSERAAAAARNWCAANGLTPEPRLVDAMAFSFAALLLGAKERPPSREEYHQRMNELVEHMPCESSEREQLRTACAQAERFVRSFDSPAAFLKSIPPPSTISPAPSCQG